MNEVTAISRQTICDLALQALGSLEGLGALIKSNRVGEVLESDDLEGVVFKYEATDIVNERVRSSFYLPPVTK